MYGYSSHQHADFGFMIGFLFGIFCAHWAQNTDRNPWVWFFFGFFLPPVAGLTLLYKNSRKQPSSRSMETGREDLLAVRKDLP